MHFWTILDDDLEPILVPKVTLLSAAKKFLDFQQ